MKTQKNRSLRLTRKVISVEYEGEEQQRHEPQRDSPPGRIGIRIPERGRAAVSCYCAVAEHAQGVRISSRRCCHYVVSVSRYSERACARSGRRSTGLSPRRF